MVASLVWVATNLEIVAIGHSILVKFAEMIRGGANAGVAAVRSKTAEAVFTVDS